MVFQSGGSLKKLGFPAMEPGWKFCACAMIEEAVFMLPLCRALLLASQRLPKHFLPASARNDV